MGFGRFGCFGVLVSVVSFGCSGFSKWPSLPAAIMIHHELQPCKTWGQLSDSPIVENQIARFLKIKVLFLKNTNSDFQRTNSDSQRTNSDFQKTNSDFQRNKHCFLISGCPFEASVNKAQIAYMTSKHKILQFSVLKSQLAIFVFRRP